MKTNILDLAKTFIITGTIFTLFKFFFSKFDSSVAAIWVAFPISLFAALAFSENKNKTIKVYSLQASLTYVLIIISLLLSLKYKINNFFIISILCLWILFAICHTMYVLKNKKNK